MFDKHIEQEIHTVYVLYKWYTNRFK